MEPSRPKAGEIDRVLLSVPPPEQPLHRLEVIYRGDAFEIAYDCGKPGLRAAARLGLAATDGTAAVFCVCEFLRQLREGELVVLVRPLDLLTRWRRRDGVRHTAEFRSVSRSARYSRSVYAWHTEPSQNAG